MSYPTEEMKESMNHAIEAARQLDAERFVIKRRIVRLERAFLLAMSSLSGETARVGTPEEQQAAYVQLATDLEAMRNDVMRDW